MQSKININKHLFTLFKVCVAAASVFFIYKRVIEKENFTGFKIFIDQKISSGYTWFTILFLLLLMFLNWVLEAMKWKLLVNKITNIKILTSLGAVFSGVTISFFTPNRVGEFAGRMMFLNPEVRVQSVLSTFIGSISQLIITIVAGLAGTILLLKKYYQVSDGVQMTLMILWIAVSVVLVFLFLHIKWITHFSLVRKLPVSVKKYISVFENYSSNDLKKILTLSFIRFLVFTFQYWLLLQMANVAMPFTTGILAISIIFLVLAVVPTIAVVELAFRGSVALAVLQVFSTNNEGILIASFGLWFINLAIPATIGSFMFLYFKLKNR